MVKSRITALELMERQERKGRLIRQLREKKGLSQQDLAKYLSISRSTLQKVENGETGTNDKKFWQFLDLMEISEAEFCHLLEGDEQRPLSEAEERINSELRASLRFIPFHVKKILHSIFCRKWGGDAERLMDIVAIHLRLPLDYRLRYSKSYVSDYALVKSMGRLQNTELEAPNIERLDIVNNEKAAPALMKGQDSY